MPPAEEQRPQSRWQRLSRAARLAVCVAAAFCVGVGAAGIAAAAGAFVPTPPAPHHPQVARDATYVVVSVATRWSAPRTRVASVRTSDGWFALAFSVTPRQVYTFDEYGADGRRLGSVGGSSPLGPKLASTTSSSGSS